MKYTKQIRFVCLLMLCVMLTGILQPAAADIKAEQLLKRMGNLTPIAGTNLLVAQESNSNKWGLYDTDANIVIPLEHEKIEYVGYRFLSVASLPEKTYSQKDKIPLDEINSHALMTLDGTVITESKYATFKAYSPLWVAGWVLEQGTKEDYDFTPNKLHYFRIRSCDIFYCGGNENAESGDAVISPVLSLTRDEYNDAFAHGDYLSVQDREKGVTVFDRQGEIVHVNVKNIKSSLYGIKNWMLVDLATNEMVMDGCSSVSEIQTEDRLLLMVTRTDFQGRKLTSLITTEGEVIIPMWNGMISSVSRDYAIITSGENGKKGLYSCRDKKLILLCEYDVIYENTNAVDRFNCHGYICVMKDQMYYCYEIATGNLLPVAQLEDGDELTRYGAAFYNTKTTGKTTTTRIISPDGKIKSLYCTISKGRGSSYLLIAKFSGGNTVVDWYGNNYLPQFYSNIIITDDDRFILNTKYGGYELYRIPE